MSLAMDAPQPDHFWKIPFCWEHGCPLPGASSRLRFVEAESGSLEHVVANVMASSTDESDQAAVAELGALGAARELLDVDSGYFQLEPGWWRIAMDDSERAIGLVLPVLLKQDRHWKDGRPLGTIYYMGVLRAYRGQGHGRELLDEALRLFVQRDCWRVICDASANNMPMLSAFRAAGFIERSPWQRPLR